MVELQTGKRRLQLKLVCWDGGSALLPIEDAGVAATLPAQRRVIGMAPSGKVLRLFPAMRTGHVTDDGLKST